MSRLAVVLRLFVVIFALGAALALAWSSMCGGAVSSVPLPRQHVEPDGAADRSGESMLDSVTDSEPPRTEVGASDAGEGAAVVPSDSGTLVVQVWASEALRARLDGIDVLLLEVAAGEVHFDDLPWDTAAFAGKLAGGRAEFTGVPLGKHWAARLETLVSLGPALARKGSGPTAPAETALIVFEPGAVSQLSGRLVDTGGAPVGAGRWVLRLEAPRRGLATVHVDADGRFALPIHLGAAWGGGARVRRTLDGWTNDATDCEGLLVFPAQPREVVALGDVVVVDLALLASGMVVDLGGRPIAGAEVSLALLDAATDARPAFPFVRIRSGVDGTFRVPDDPTQRQGWDEDLDRANFRMTAAAEGFAAETLDVPSGARGLVVTLQPEGRLTVQLVHTDQELCERFVCLVRNELTGVRARANVEEGQHRFESLAPGTYRLELVLSYLVEPLLTLEGLQVPSGGQCRDPRLAPLALDHLIERAQFDVRDAVSGAPIVPFRLSIVNDTDTYSLELGGEQRAAWWVRPLLRPMPVVVDAQGFHDSAARPLEALHRVLLEPRRQLRIVPADGQRIPDGVTLLVHSEGSYTSSEDGRSFVLWDEAPGPLRVRYEERWWLPEGDPARAEPPVWVDVDVPDTLVHEVLLDLRGR